MKVMKTFYNKYLKSFGIATAVLAMVACSSDIDEIQEATTDFDNLHFTVNVTIADADSRATAAETKTAWEAGDQVYLILDGDKENLCKLTCVTTDDLTKTTAWEVSKLSSLPATFAESGTACAVYAEKLSFAKVTEIRTQGDILYTTKATYTRQGNNVVINVPMDTRPVAKITINNSFDFPDSIRIKGFKECTNLDFTTMTWSDNGREGLDNAVKDKANTYSYYGTLEPVDGNTVMVLEDRDRKTTWTRTFTGKIIKPGTYYTITGPRNATGAKPWAVLAKNDDVNGILGTTMNCMASSSSAAKLFSFKTGGSGTGFDKNTAITFESSDPSIVSVTGKGTSAKMTMAAVGTATITASYAISGGETQKAVFDVVVRDADSYVSGKWGTSYAAASSVSNPKFGYTVQNKMPVYSGLSLTPVPDVVVKTIKVLYSWGDYSETQTINKTIKASTASGYSTAGESYSGTTTLISNATWINNSYCIFEYTCNGKQYELKVKSSATVDSEGKIKI